MTVLTLAALNPDDQAAGRRAVADAVGLDEGHGDSLSFEVGPIDTPSPASAPPAGPVPPLPVELAPASAGPAQVPLAKGLSDRWILALGALALGIAAMFLVRRRQPALSAIERDAFVARLREQLHTSGDARA
jgi:hypothetical protein